MSGRDRLRTLGVESLEGRRVLAVLYVAEAAGFTDPAHPGNPQTGDTVTWNGGGQFTTPVSGLTFGANAFTSINAAITAASAGNTIDVAPGSYSESVNINQSVTLDGAGGGSDPTSNTIINAGGGVGLTLAASGASTAEPLLVEDLRVQGGSNGIFIDSAISHVKLDGVATVGNTNAGVEIHNSAAITDLALNNVAATGNAVGFRVATTGSVNGLTITSSHFDNNLEGLYTNANSSSSTNQNDFTNIAISDTTFNNNTTKGIYVEKLDHAVFNGIAVDASGTGTASPAGIDVNLKHGDYQNLTIENSSITNSGTGASTGVGVTIKSRNAAYGPNTLSGVTLTGNVISGNQTNLVIGEPEDLANNPTQVTINDNDLSNSVTGTALANFTPTTLDARENWWGTNDAVTIAGHISGSVAFSPYLDNGSNSVTTGAGFQGDLTHLDVTTMGQQIGNVGPIEQAILAAPAGGTVAIQAGTYTEDDVVVDKNLTLQGDGTVVLQAPTINSGIGITITGNPQTLTIAGFDIEGFHSSLQSNGGGTLNLINIALHTGAPLTVSPGIVVVGFPPPPPLPSSNISNVTNLNLIDTTGASRTASIITSGVAFFDGYEVLALANVGNLSATTDAADFTFNVSPLANTTVTVNGDSQQTQPSPSNSLYLYPTVPAGAKLMIESDPPGFSGSWTFTNAKPVNFTHIETISPSTVTANGGGQTITATETVSTGSVVVATFTDQANLPLADYSANIDWGDGTSSTGTVAFDATSGVYSVSGSHTYAEDGSEQIAVTVHRVGTADATLHGTATVVEPPLVAGVMPGVIVVGNEGSSYSVSYDFAHGGNTEPASGFTATIDWGDGTSSAGTVSLRGSSYNVTGSHVFADEGNYTAKTTVIDTSGGASVMFTATIPIRETLLPSGFEGTPNQRFVSELFGDLLHRPVDAVGLTYWSGRLDAGTSRLQVAAGIENSDEYRQVEVDALFEQYLHRHADAGALASFGTFLKSGGSDEQLAALIVGSDEYFSQRGGGTTDGFLNALFEDALNRPIDANAKIAFEQFLSGGGSRGQAAEIVFSTPEYHGEVVQNLYQDTLDRPADAGGLSLFGGLLDDGATDEQVRAILMGSDEYFAKTS